MKVTYLNAISDALKEEMRRDEKMVIYGEDVAQFGNIFGVTATLPLLRRQSSAAPLARL